MASWLVNGIVGIYFFECLAFAAGMATQVFTLGLSFIWGVILSRWLKLQSPIRALIFSWQVALYGCLPTITFGIIVPVAWTIAGNSPFTKESGINFGIPEFIPGPLGTVAGFAAALILGTIFLKSFITVGEVSIILHINQRHDG